MSGCATTHDEWPQRLLRIVHTALKISERRCLRRLRQRTLLILRSRQSFRDVKAHAIFFLLELEKQGKVTRQDGYQGILDAIAGDVRSKHRKRIQRQQEKASMREALSHLKERRNHFEEQIKSYHDYVEGAMATMQRGKGPKKRFVMPFTKQYFHLRDLQKSGKSPKFGSYVYTAQRLCDKGILLSIDQISPNHFERIDIVMSCNKIGVFTIKVVTSGGVSGPTVIAETEVGMEDLLQAQFENKVSLSLFDGMAKMNLNLLLYQINKKYAFSSSICSAFQKKKSSFSIPGSTYKLAALRSLLWPVRAIAPGPLNLFSAHKYHTASPHFAIAPHRTSYHIICTTQHTNNSTSSLSFEHVHRNPL